MAKRQVNIRMSEESYDYLVSKCESENKTRVEVIEQLLKQDEQKKNNYIDDLADAIYKRLSDKISLKNK